MDIAIRASMKLDGTANDPVVLDDNSPEFSAFSDGDESFSFEELDSPSPRSRDSFDIPEISPQEDSILIPDEPILIPEPILVPEEPVLTPLVEPKGYLAEAEANCFIKVRLPGGKALSGNFKEDDLVEDVFHFVRFHQECSPIPQIVQGFFSLHVPPRSLLTEVMRQGTLQAACKYPRPFVFELTNWSNTHFAQHLPPEPSLFLMFWLMIQTKWG